MDNIISVVKRKKGQQLLEYLHAQHGQIKFIMEEEREMGRYHLQISHSPGMNTGRLGDKCIVSQHTPIGMCSSHRTILCQ